MSIGRKLLVGIYIIKHSYMVEAGHEHRRCKFLVEVFTSLFPPSSLLAPDACGINTSRLECYGMVVIFGGHGDFRYILFAGPLARRSIIQRTFDCILTASVRVLAVWNQALCTSLPQHRCWRDNHEHLHEFVLYMIQKLSGFDMIDFVLVSLLTLFLTPLKSLYGC
jgi:hypothetical protein